MRRAREAELARLTTRATAADDAAAWRSAALRARVKIGTALRRALAQAGIDPAVVATLRIGDEAAQELAMIADRPEPPTGATPLTGDRLLDGSAALFATRIDELVRRYRDRQGIDFAGASLAEALAWCLGRPASSLPPLTGAKREAAGARLFAADLLHKQRQDGAR